MHTLLASTALLLALPTLAVAGEEPTPQPQQLPPILVTGEARGYVALNSVTATRTDTPLLDVPQSVTVITREPAGRDPAGPVVFQ